MRETQINRTSEPQRIFFYVVDRTNGKLISATSYASLLEYLEGCDGAACAGRLPCQTPEGNRVCPERLCDELDVADIRSTDETFLRDRAGAVDIFATAPQPYEAGHAYYGSAYS